MLFKKAEQRLQNRAHDQHWRDRLESEYEAFATTVKDWQQLQMDRVSQAGQEIGQGLRNRFDDSVLRTRLKELEYSLRQQKKRLHVLIGETATVA